MVSGCLSVRSNARPHYYYGDPAIVVERLELDALGCRACKSHKIVFSRVVCGDVRNERQTGVPCVGHHCPLFNDRG